MITPLEDRVMGAKYCSYRVGGPLDEPYMPATLEEALSVLALVKSTNKPLTILGTGSNTIIASQGIRGITLLSKRLTFVQAINETTLEIGAGMPLAKVCKLMQDQNLTGAEFMIGIPGTLGGAVTMNAGALGQETASIVENVRVYNLETGEQKIIPKQDLAFTYRHSAIAYPWIVLAATLSLSPGNPEQIALDIQKNLTFRQTHHPKEPNGGSVFANPSLDMPCGKMLDEAGAKGWQEGGAKISPMHANFIINTGSATSTDILKLMRRMKQTIQSQYGLTVYPENRFIGDATSEEKAIWEELTGRDWAA